jgi:3-oxoacyl-(acyl-carrier-protein) synthase
MKTILPVLTGIGSVTPYGPLAGLIDAPPPQPSAITAWATPELRRAFQVEPFRPADIVPGVKTRRLDRLSVWALVAASLALRDAGIDLEKVDRSRVAVVFASGFGCLDLTAAFFQSAVANGWAATDPITFPETLGNAPAGHVALFHQLRGPNITLASKTFAAESALLQAASFLRHGQAEIAVVLAGDTLTQAVYEWYEEAHLLSPACFRNESVSRNCGYVPSEGVTAVVLEAEVRDEVRPYAALHSGRWAAQGDVQSAIDQLMGGVQARFIFCANDGAPCSNSPANSPARGMTGEGSAILPAEPVAAGMAETGGLLHLRLALSKRPGPGQALQLGVSAHGGYAALRLEIF